MAADTTSSTLSKTAKKSTGKKETDKKRYCTKCKTGETIVVKYAGFGPMRGFYWTCQTPCGFTEPSRG